MAEIAEPPKLEQAPSPLAPTKAALPQAAEIPAPVPKPASIPPQKPTPQAATAASASRTTSPAAQAAPSRPAPAPTPKKPPAPPSQIEILLRRWIFGGNPIVKIGVLILFLGLAFLLRYASEHVVVPIELRYAGCWSVGVCGCRKTITA